LTIGIFLHPGRHFRFAVTDLCLLMHPLLPLLFLPDKVLSVYEHRAHFGNRISFKRLPLTLRINHWL
jgi:hypothetical protein